MGFFAKGYEDYTDPNANKPGYTFNPEDGLYHDAAWWADRNAPHPGATWNGAIGRWVADTLSGSESDIQARGVGDLNDQMANNLADESRAAQVAGLSLQQAAAMGSGPSAAAAQQAQMGGQGLLSSLANHSMGGASQGLGQVAQQAAATRSDEMGNALSAYGQGAGQLRGGDQNYQQGVQSLAIKQRGLNLSQAAQNQSQIQSLEQSRYDNDVAALALQRQRAGINNSRIDANNDQYNSTMKAAGSVAGAVVLGAATGGAGAGAGAAIGGGLADAATHRSR